MTSQTNLNDENLTFLFIWRALNEIVCDLYLYIYRKLLLS